LETKRAFVRYVSHEIRTPLNSACLGLELLQKEIDKYFVLINNSKATGIIHSKRDGSGSNLRASSGSFDEVDIVGNQHRPLYNNPAAKPMHIIKESLLDLVADSHQACNIAVEILNDLLMYEKIDGGIMVLEANEVNLWPLMDEALKIFTVQVRFL